MSDEPSFDIGIVDRPPDPLPRQHKDRRNGYALGLLAVVVALAVLIAVPMLLSDSESEPEEELAQDIAEPRDDADDAAAVRDDLLSSPDPVTSTDIQDLFRDPINANGKRYGIAYVSRENFVVLDDRGITLPELEIAVEFPTVANLALLTAAGRTWAVNTRDRAKNYLVSNSYVVVVSGRPDTIAIIRPDDTSSIGLMSSALPVPPVLLPDGAELLWVQRRGPLVLPRTGGTYEVIGIASSLEKVSDDRAVAASLTSTVFESCDETLACRFVAEVKGQEPIELPFEPGTNLTISPDGRWLTATDERMSVYRLEDDIEPEAPLMIFDAEPNAIAWAPDSRFVVSSAGNAMSIFFPQTQELRTLQLDLAPDVDSLLVFEG